jgi:multidrug efflux pump subunit AcrA (membrane-fusion protein)
MAETEENDIQIKTEEVNELLTAVPGWIMRWGITLIFAAMLASLLAASFLKYPDKLTALTVVTTLNPPARMISKSNGKVSAMLTRNDQIVKPNDVLMVIENTANYTHVLYASALLDTFQTNLKLKKRLPLILAFDSLQMGDLTPSFLSFLKSYNDYKLFQDVNPQLKEIDIINKELETYKLLFVKNQAQEDNFRQEFELAEKDYARYTSLFQNGTIAQKEYDDKNREYLSAKRNYENVKINNLNNNITLNNLEKNRLQLQIQEYQEREKYALTLNQAIQSLKSAIESWDQNYLIRAPIAGKVSLFNYWSTNQNIRQGDEVLSIVPVEKQEMIAKLVLPVGNSGKLKKMQRVNIKLNNYPYQEFGTLNGYVKSISIMPKDNNYAVEVSLPEKLRTSYKKDLDYKEEMQGTAEIITEELTVLDRIFYQFRKMTK